MSEPFLKEYSAGRGHRSIVYKVQDVCLLYVTQYRGVDGKWKVVSITWTSGGGIGEEDSIDAAGRFSAALHDAVATATAWESERNQTNDTTETPQEPEHEACGTTHYAGCACHEQGWENRWKAAIELAARATAERDALLARGKDQQ